MGFLRRHHGVTPGRTEVTWRPRKETSLAPPCSNLRSFGSKCNVLKKKIATFLELFGAPYWIGSRGIMPPLTSSLCPWYDTSPQSAQLWNLHSPECRTTCPNWDITATLVRPDIQNATRKTGEKVLLAKPTGKCPRGLPRPRWSDGISDIVWSHLGVEPIELSEISVDCEVFQVLGLLPPRPSLEQMRACKWMKWTKFTLLSLFTGV